jgi:hypothetical protein
MLAIYYAGKQQVCILLVSSTKPITQKFSTLLYIVLLPGTAVTGYFYKTLTTFSITHTLQKYCKSTFFVPPEKHFSHAVTCSKDDIRQNWASIPHFTTGKTTQFWLSHLA